MLERGRISCQRHSYTSCSETEHNVVSLNEKVKVRWGRVTPVLATIEMGQQRTWDQIPKRNCMWEKQRKREKCEAKASIFLILFFVETRNAAR